MSEANETVLEIDLSAITHNYTFLNSKLDKETSFLAVVKAFAYGSDSIAIAKKLQDLNVDYFAVAYANEGVVLRGAGITKPILVLHPQLTNLETIIERCLEPSLYNAKILNAFIKVAEVQKQTKYPVHLKFNTGLNRLGFWENDVDYIVSKLKASDSIIAKSVFSHLAASEDKNELSFTKSQINSFEKTAIEFKTKIGYKPWLHLCNTSGALNYPNAHYNMVRCGIGLYGFGNSAQEDDNLTPVAALKSVISQIHMIEKGESVGYNRAYISNGFEKTATIPIGHADGIGRQYGNEKTMVFVNNKPAPIIGNVCMDMLMINITGIECEEGDEVVFFDKDYPANQFANSANTISYEILTAISQRVKRRILT